MPRKPAWSKEEKEDLALLTRAEWLARYPHRTERAYATALYQAGISARSHDAAVQTRRDILGETATDPETPDPLVLLAAMKQVQQEVRKLVTAQREVTITLPSEKPVGVCFLADLHIGSEGTDYEQLERHIALIKATPRLYCYMGGDAVDNFILDKMAGAARSQLVQVPAQWFLFEHFLRELGPKIVAVGAGNHDNWVRQVAGIDRVADIARGLKLVYTGLGGLLRLRVGSQEYKIYRRHKYRYWSSLNPLWSVKRMYDLGEATFDVGCLEHSHLGVAEEFWRHGERRIAVVVGSMKCVDDYALQQGFYGAQVCSPVVLFWPGQRRYELRTSLESAAEELARM